MIPADIKCPGQVFNGQILCQMFVNIGDEVQDLGIAGTGTQVGQAVSNGSPVQVDHKFQEKYLTVKLAGVGIVGKGLL